MNRPCEIWRRAEYIAPEPLQRVQELSSGRLTEWERGYVGALGASPAERVRMLERILERQEAP